MFKDRLMKPLFYLLKMLGVKNLKRERKNPSLFSFGLDLKPAPVNDLANAEAGLLCEKLKFDNTLRRLKYQHEEHFPARDDLFLKDGENMKDFGIYKLVRLQDKDGKPTNATILALTLDH